uniref:Uncharacterized protein n=1 Tax=Octopus bimaculoides TaxID=37653 RepID=A0A0L8HJD1_OCTBM
MPFLSQAAEKAISMTPYRDCNVFPRHGGSEEGFQKTEGYLLKTCQLRDMLEWLRSRQLTSKSVVLSRIFAIMIFLKFSNLNTESV